MKIVTAIKSEQGIAIALVAIGMVVMIGAAALALDAGQLFITGAWKLWTVCLAGCTISPDDQSWPCRLPSNLPA